MTAVPSVKYLESLKQVKILLPGQLTLYFFNLLLKEYLVLEKLR